MNMKKTRMTAAILIGATSLVSNLVHAAEGIKSCDELKAEIAAKLDAKQVKGYQLEVIATQDVGDRKVVGSCEGGQKKIVYSRK